MTAELAALAPSTAAALKSPKAAPDVAVPDPAAHGFAAMLASAEAPAPGSTLPRAGKLLPAAGPRKERRAADAAGEAPPDPQSGQGALPGTLPIVVQAVAHAQPATIGSQPALDPDPAAGRISATPAPIVARVVPLANRAALLEPGAQTTASPVPARPGAVQTVAASPRHPVSPDGPAPAPAQPARTPLSGIALTVHALAPATARPASISVDPAPRPVLAPVMPLTLPDGVSPSPIAVSAPASPPPRHEPRMSGPLLPLAPPADGNGLSPARDSRPAAEERAPAPPDRGIAADGAQTTNGAQPPASPAAGPSVEAAIRESFAAPSLVASMAGGPPAQPAADAPSAPEANGKSLPETANRGLATVAPAAPAPRSGLPAAQTKREGAAAAIGVSAVEPSAPRATLAGDLQPVLSQRDGGAQPQSAAGVAAAPAPAAPADLGTLVDRLVAARAASQTAGVGAHLAHADFGRIDLSFSSDAAGLTVGLRSRDPDFAPSVQAAATAPPLPPATTPADPPPPSPGARTDSGASSGAASQGSNRDQGRSPAPASTAEHAASGASARAAGRNPRGTAGGIYA